MNATLAHLPAIYGPARGELKLALGPNLVRWTLRVALRLTSFDPKAIAHAEQSVGRRLAEVTSPDDIRFVLDDPDESVLLAIDQIAAIAGNPWLVRLARAVPTRTGWGHSLGRIAAAQIEMADTYFEELAKLIPSGDAARQLAAAGDSARERDLAILEFIYDIETPTELATALLSARRFGSALLALGHAVEHPKALPPSVVNEVAGEFAAAAKNALRLAALNADGQIDERVLPRRERLDLSAIDAAHAEELSHLDLLPHQPTVSG